MPYTVNDHRGKESPKEVCRVCGAPVAWETLPAGSHSKAYDNPTMACIEYLRKQIKELEGKLARDSGVL